MAFMNDDFLLESNTAKTLYHDFAAGTPIIDYHCHIDAADIFENRQFSDLSAAWLNGDHYKWRLMRANGTAERYITGDSSGFEKFMAFADVLPRSIGNPVYHWSHLELQRFFDCEKPLNPGTAKEIWEICSEKLKHDESLRVRGIINRMNVEVIVTTDDPADNLDYHKKLASDSTLKTKVLPGWRPGAVMDIESAGFSGYLARLAEASGVEIKDFSTLKSALLNRLEFFNDRGCRTSDHGILQLIYTQSSDKVINDLLVKRLRGEILSSTEADLYRYALMSYLGKEYARLGWVMELHLGVKRSINSVMFDLLGPDTGFDCIDPSASLAGLAEFLNELNSMYLLPRTLIFSINPAYNNIVNTLAGCFPEEGVRGKVQQGSAWWFNDTYHGMEQQMTVFAENGVLANFIGMLTDSRSFMSYTRHEYFRRILCNLIGGWVETGKYPADMGYLRCLVQDICYNNAKSFFCF